MKKSADISIDRPMGRILIIGSPGSGKSTFARKLAAATNLPLYYLDMLWHRPDRTTVPREEFDSALDDILACEHWIIDGNYCRTLRRRLARADAVFIFDLPPADCIRGVEARIGTRRADMPWVENEFDPEFREYILNFRDARLPEIKRLVAEAACSATVFHSRAEADEYIENLSNNRK